MLMDYSELSPFSLLTFIFIDNIYVIEIHEENSVYKSSAYHGHTFCVMHSSESTYGNQLYNQHLRYNILDRCIMNICIIIKI